MVRVLVTSNIFDFISSPFICVYVVRVPFHTGLLADNVEDNLGCCGRCLRIDANNSYGCGSAMIDASQVSRLVHCYQ